jgi:hypothetical protein
LAAVGYASPQPGPSASQEPSAASQAPPSLPQASKSGIAAMLAMKRGAQGSGGGPLAPERSPAAKPTIRPAMPQRTSPTRWSTPRGGYAVSQHTR